MNSEENNNAADSTKEQLKINKSHEVIIEESIKYAGENLKNKRFELIMAIWIEEKMSSWEMATSIFRQMEIRQTTIIEEYRC